MAPAASLPLAPPLEECVARQGGSPANFQNQGGRGGEIKGKGRLFFLGEKYHSMFVP